MVLTILFGAMVYVTLNTITAAVIPAGYGSWNEYIDAFWSLDGLSSLPTFNAAHTLLGDAGLVFLGIAVLAAGKPGIIGFYMATSRLLYSMAKDGVIPMWFGKLHPRYKTPALFYCLRDGGLPCCPVLWTHHITAQGMEWRVCCD